MECLKIKLHNIQELKYENSRFTIIVKQGRKQWVRKYVIECLLERKQAEILLEKIMGLVKLE
jgi:hypothetical protein